ncbi:FG-GAP-like repeat-containing protein [Alcanivorax marinus]|uniref:FG-GAP-like repeat-containing protein n=1 Tax=Alloalcanivorax marinus TaxID=1177169 RepID=A0A9Q3YTG6_9GAMM|nr:RHS repeat-associated core domain-containing protein [Alloalcanivorax marinus]MCC4310608.1 FG-GAP-like repeat-containing protein [Alloalcanivorax marinus]
MKFDRRGCLLALILLVFGVSQAFGFEPVQLKDRHYKVYHEDIASIEYGLDGLPDILLRAIPFYVPIGVGALFPIPVDTGYKTMLFCGRPSGEFVPCALAPGFEWPDEETEDFDFLIGDFDGDGALDVVLHSKDSSRNSLYLNNSKDGNFSLKDQFTHIGGYWVSGNDNIQVTDEVGAHGAEIVIDGERYAEAQDGKFESTRRTNLIHSLVGASQANFSVAQGQANFSIPIQVATGGAGITPNVSVSYSSGSDYGQAGMGFHISGLSSIRRCGHHNLQDGFARGIDGTTGDLACLDGSRLVLVSGTYWQNGSRYRLEQEDSSRFVFENGGFTQYRKDGDIYRYGNSENSRARGIRASNAVGVWALETVSDRLGYGYRISYLPDRATFFPEKIEYTIQAGSNQDGYAQVEFNYEADPYQRSVAVLGRKFNLGLRLKSIYSRAGGDSLREYYFEYTENEITRRSLMEGFSECDNGGDCFQPTALNWQKGDPVNFGNGQYIAFPDNNPDASLMVEGLAAARFNRWADVNKDGIDDYCRISPSGWEGIYNEVLCYLYDGSGEFNDSVVVNAGLKRLYGKDLSEANWNIDPAWVDINNDGYVDFCYSVPIGDRDWDDRDRLKCHINSGGETINFDQTVSFVIDRPASIYAISSRDWVDFNGDGHLDYCFSYMREDENKYVTCAIKQGAAFQFNDRALVQRIERVGGYWVDVNGDGLPDYCRTKKTSITCDINNDGQDLTGGRWSKSGSNFASSETYNDYHMGGTTKFFSARYFDFTGNGYSDYCRIYSVKESGAAGYRAKCLESTGEGWGVELSSPFLMVHPNPGSGIYFEENLAEATQFMDVNDDGLMDWCAEAKSELKCMLSTPSGFGTSVVSYTLPDLGTQVVRGLREINRGWADTNGDGAKSYCALYWMDIFSSPIQKGMACFDSGSTEKRDYLTKVTNGFGLSYEVEYEDIADPAVYSYDTNAGPHGEIYVTSGMNVVSQLKASNGIGGFNTQSYFYKNYGYLESEVGGLGFRYIETTSEEGKRLDQVWYLHEPYLHQTGYVERSKTSYVTGSGTLQEVSSQENVWETAVYEGPGFNVVDYDDTIWNGDSETGLRYRVQQVESESISHDLNGAFIQSSSSTHTYDDFGNLTNAVETTSGLQQSFTKTVVSQFDDHLNDWILGRLIRSSVTHTGTYQGTTMPAITKVSEWEYYSASQSPFGGMLKKEIIEPDQSDLRKEKSYTYNSFGLKETVTTSASGLPPRTVQFGYDARGRFRTSVTNDLGHQVVYSYDEVTGAKLTEQDPNGLVSSWQYDSVGRVVQERSPGGQSTEVRLSACLTGCPAHAVYYSESWQASASGAVMSPKTREYKDNLGRTVQTRTQGLDGTYIYNVAQYDAQGRLLRSSQPYQAGGTVHWDEVLERDVMGRPIRRMAASGALTETQFNGLTTSQTTSWTGQLGAGAQVRVSSVTDDVTGNMRKATDNDGRQITYLYDATGQLTKALLPGGVELVNQYDLLGRKVLSSDPNIGTWRYAYDGYDQLVLQENGSGRRVCFSYDVLGRQVARTDDYLSSSDWAQSLTSALNGCQGQLADTSWSYDAFDKGVGRLASLQTSAGYTQEPFYDSLGRVVRTETRYAQTDYVSTQQYDADTGKVASMTPTHRDQGPSVSVEYRYNNLGFLTELGKAGSSDYYWRILAQNARGDVTQRRFANGMIENQAAYNDATGMISQIRSKMTLAPSWSIQDENYVYDANGNLLQRSQTNTAQNVAIEETFEYDDLDRLIRASVDNLTNPDVSFEQTAQYDIAGNLTARNDVGSYTYQETCEYQGEIYTPGPNAVTQVTGARNEQYCYDAGGNMLTGGNKTISYTSFNKPVSISTPDAQVQFVYGPSREILRKVSTASNQSINKTSIGSYETLTISKAGATTVKERWSLPGGVVVSLENDDTSTLKDEYLFSDALGSVVAVANQLGGVNERFQYDPWGRPRQGLDWASLSDLDWFDLERDENTTGKGFTGHEMLDQIGVIHMGGRIYDPTLGRFMSADPVVKGLQNTESYNRYSYVLNNPMSYTDPTGYSWWSKNVTDKWRKFRKKYEKELLNFATGGVEAAFRYGSRELARFAARNKYAGEVLGVIVIAGCTLSGFGTPACVASMQGIMTAGITHANGGSVDDALKAGARAGALSYSNARVAGYIGGVKADFVGKGLMHGARGAVFAVAGGADIGSGFVGGLTEGMLGGYIQDHISPNTDAGGVMAAALISGSASELTGGKFAVGAAAGAMGYLFNQLSDRSECSGRSCNRSVHQNRENSWANSTSIVAEMAACTPGVPICGGLSVFSSNATGPSWTRSLGYGQGAFGGLGLDLPLYGWWHNSSANVWNNNKNSGSFFDFQVGPVGFSIIKNLDSSGNNIYRANMKLRFGIGGVSRGGVSGAGLYEEHKFE